MTSIPMAIRDTLRDKLWSQCDDLGWMSLSDTERARHYELWTRDSSIGGQLAHLMDARKVRVYIKDSLVKPYVRARLSLNEGEVWRLLGLSAVDQPMRHFIKPHGSCLADGRIIGWGRSRDWKSVLMAVFERAHADAAYSPFGVVLLESGKTEGSRARGLVRDVGTRLGIEKLVWLE
jgi:hypothetical protein